MDIERRDKILFITRVFSKALEKKGFSPELGDEIKPSYFNLTFKSKEESIVIFARYDESDKENFSGLPYLKLVSNIGRCFYINLVDDYRLIKNWKNYRRLVRTEADVIGKKILKLKEEEKGEKSS